MNNDDIIETSGAGRQLKAGLRETSPEFEARWVALKRDWRRAPHHVPARTRAAAWAGWLGLPLGALAVWSLLVVFGPARPAGQERTMAAAGATPQAISELLELNGALTEGLVLADADVLETLDLLSQQEDLPL